MRHRICPKRLGILSNYQKGKAVVSDQFCEFTCCFKELPEEERGCYWWDKEKRICTHPEAKELGEIEDEDV